MSLRFFLLVLFLSAISVICANCTNSEASTSRQQEVVLDDGTLAAGDSEDVVIIDDSSLPGGELGITGSKPNSVNESKTNYDGSKITVMVDNYGNRSETRCFNNDPRIKCIIIETSATGVTNVTVYGKNGVSKVVSKEKIKDALNASADEIANAAELSEQPQQADITKLIRRKNDSANLKPLPSSEFPVFPKMIPQTPVEAVEEEPVEESDSKTTKQVETRTSKPEFEDEK